MRQEPVRFIVPVEQLLDVRQYPLRSPVPACAASPGLLNSRPTSARSAEPKLSNRANWLLASCALVVAGVLTLVLWLVGSNHPTAVTLVSEPASTGRRVAQRPVAVATDSKQNSTEDPKRPLHARARSERALNPQARPAQSDPALTQAPSAALRREPLNSRPSVPEAPAKPKHQSVLGSVLAPPPN